MSGALQKRILFCGRQQILACDGRCDKAWGINGRPRHYFGDPDEDPDDFEGRTEHVVLHEATARAWELAPSFCPHWASITSGSRRMFARNVHQILGSTCDNPASFVARWTIDGDVTAEECGTLSAIRCASTFGVPVYNLRREDHRAMWEEFAASSEAIALPR